MPGDTEVTKTDENTVAEPQENVLSQTSENPNNEETVKTDNPKSEKTPEQREHDRQAFLRRQEHREWKKKLAEQSVNVDEIANQAIAEEGFDLNDDATKKQAKILAKTLSRFSEEKEKKNRDVLVKSSSAILTETLKDLDFDPSSPSVIAIGNYLFRKFGVDNPDVYADRTKIEDEIKNFGSVFSRGKTETKTNPVKEALIKKAGTPKPTEPKAGPTVSQVNETKKLASEMNVSESKASKILELNKKLPARFRRK